MRCRAATVGRSRERRHRLQARDASDERTMNQLVPTAASGCAEHELGRLLALARTRRATRPGRGRRLREPCRRAPRRAGAAPTTTRDRRGVSPSSTATCTPTRSPPTRPAIRAARRINASPPGTPVMPTTTRSRVSHVFGYAVGRRGTSCSDSSTRSATHSSASSRNAPRLPGRK